jgi:hypothetical protein
MLDEFPIGDPYEVKEWQNGLLGIYKVKYTTNKKLMVSPLPRREEGKLIWDLVDGEGWYTSIDIQNAQDDGYSFEIERGIVWPLFESEFEKMLQGDTVKVENKSVFKRYAWSLPQKEC